MENYEDSPTIKESKVISKEVKVQHTGRQYVLQLPIDFIEALEIEKGDIFILKVPLNDIKNYSIKLKREVK